LSDKNISARTIPPQRGVTVMSRQVFLSAVVTTICLFFCTNKGAAQITGGTTRGNQQTTGNTGGGLIGGNATGGTGGGLIGGGGGGGGGTGGSVGGGINNANQGGIRAQAGNFQDLSAMGGGATSGRGGQSTRQFGGGGRGGAGRGTGGGARGGGQVQSPRRVIRPVLRIAFDYPQATAKVESSLNRGFDHISARLQNRFQFLSLKASDKGVVTLTGQVQSVNDKKLAAAYVRLEPGVRKIENNLTVATSR
jgi:hypothetical protein